MTTILVTHDQEEAFALADRMGVMQMGRLLETGSPEELYRHPTTRFVARFLGAANLFLGEVSGQGLRLGTATLTPDRSAPQAAVGTEAVLVVRPEDIEIAPLSSAPLSPPFAGGKVRALTFAGHQQYVSIELDELSGVETATGDGRGAGEAVSVDALRSAAEQTAAPLSVGSAVNLGVRRLHALPTPISSFRLLSTDAVQSAALEASPLLTQLLRSMQARVIRHSPTGAHVERLDAGICVLPLGADTPGAIGAAVAQGARRLLCIPPLAALPTRMLIYAGDEMRSSALLALVSSAMRHLPVPTTAVTVQRPEASRGEVVEAQRKLLDTRADLRSAHGLDLRGERFVGDLRGWLRQVAAQPEPVLIVLELPVRPETLAEHLSGELAPLFSPASRAAVLFAVEVEP